MPMMLGVYHCKKHVTLHAQKLKTRCVRKWDAGEAREAEGHAQTSSLAR
jgi:hypothetical protein